MINGVEQLFMCLLIICISSLQKYVFKFFAQFLIELFWLSCDMFFGKKDSTQLLIHYEIAFYLMFTQTFYWFQKYYIPDKLYLDFFSLFLIIWFK